MFERRGNGVSWLVILILIVILLGLLLYFGGRFSDSGRSTDPNAGGPSKPTVDFLTPQQELLNSEEFTKALQGTGDCNDIRFDDTLKEKCVNNAYYQDAIRRSDSSVCLLISNIELKNTCLSRVNYALAQKTRNYDLCNQVSGDLQIDCFDQQYYFEATQGLQLDLCDSIRNENLRLTCLDEVSFALAVESGNTAACNTLISASLLNRCRDRIQAIQIARDLAASKTIPDRPDYSDPKAGCDRLEGNRKAECEDKAQLLLATQSLDLNDCRSIQSESQKSHCVDTLTTQINSIALRRAISEQNPDLCQEILSDEVKTLCVEQLR